ncbi:prion-like-(Q/N-rich) domain-bearing protein 25 [Microplitis mediator]|uniref:prion-like-(Q/N-rich) domain-bearing protein 25 n=1 Tax=Microplitis mediator TaxID=375433 RepID=UPI0025566C54|nr:prion-like-(Q/N-rich) domain-bearing protein 25 [Microplitis mediator]
MSPKYLCLTYIDIIIFIGLLINPIIGNKEADDKPCAHFLLSCDPEYPKPCCTYGIMCKPKAPGGYFICVPEVLLGQACFDNSDCDDVAHAICSKSKQCVCRENHLQTRKNKCTPLLGEFCQIDEICMPSNSQCINNECQCNENYMQLSNNRCLPKVIGTHCESDHECEAARFSICAKNNTCVCNSNYAAIDSTACAPLLNGFCWADNECVVRDSTCVHNRCKCIPSLSPESNNKCSNLYIGMQCDNDSHCNHVIKHSRCDKAKLCTCDNNYYAINGTFCGPLLNISCSDNEPCAIDNSICIDNKCQCRPNYEYQLFQCIPQVLRGFCKTHQNCGLISNSHCFEKTCECKNGYFQFDDKTCAPILNTFCWNDNYCKIQNSVCIDNKCECKPNFSKFSNKLCLPTQLEQPCKIHFDCQLIKSAICSGQNKCICTEDYGQYNSTICGPLLGSLCFGNEYCATDNSICTHYRCKCKEGYLQQSHDRCISKYIGKFCELDEDCDEVRHSKCFKQNNTCVCRANNIQINETICAPLLGQYCWEDEQCAPDNSVCDNRECACEFGYLRVSNDQCLPLNLGPLCRKDEDCRNIKFSKCSENNECVCKQNYIEFDSYTCLSLLGGYCDEDDDCKTFYSRCSNNICQCDRGYLPRSNNDCLPTRLGIDCKIDEDCDKPKYSLCSDDEKCICKTNYIVLDGLKCVPLLNEECSEDVECITENSDCIDNKCQCKPQFEPESNNQCLSKYLRNQCNTDKDCEKINNSRCSLNKSCVCKQGYIGINGTTCAPALGEHCMVSEECAVDDSTCVNNKCQCQSNFNPFDKSLCIRIDPTKFCFNDQDCQEIQFSRCEGYRCLCKKNYFPLKSRLCVPMLGGFCRKNSDCIVDKSICEYSSCKCKRHYTAEGRHMCKPITLGKRCEEDKDCETIPNAICSENKICVCDANNYAWNISRCTPMLGGSCSAENQCVSDTFVCVDNICECRIGYVTLSNKHCTEASTIPSCIVDSDCSDSWHLKCSESKKCVCKSNNIALDRSTCLPLLGGYCWANHQCTAGNSFCHHHQCLCKPFHVAVSINFCAPM